MPCSACGGRKANVRYVYTDPKGRQSSHTNKTSAEAARIRAGGGGSIKTEPIK